MVLNQTLGLNALRQDLNRLFYSAPIGQPAFGSSFFAQPFYGQAFYGQHAGLVAQAPQLLAGQVYPTVQPFGHFVPKANWAEAPEGTFLTVELPGVELSQVSLRIEGACLILEGIRHPGGLLGDRMISYNMAEGRFGAFRWICPIPNGTVATQIEASFRNGLLQIMLPRLSAHLVAPQMSNGQIGIAATPAMSAAPSAQVVITPGING